MKVGYCTIPQHEAERALVERSGASWVRFGNKLFLFAADAEWASVSREAASFDLELHTHPDRVPKANLHLVIQKGRLFQQSYPEIPVLFDKGRYLVVALDPKAAKVLADQPHPTFFV
ncbi:MAG: Zn-dependent exopeptidase M28, partial [Deltaproteobacteria bacterium]|nr:Zn-dependent exopeptidase M28 [Deltaproteobacteria bacterium]